MSTSFYRGKLVTDEELKGPFTEADDDLSYGFNILKEQAELGPTARIHINEQAVSSVHGVDGERTKSVMFITATGVIVELKADGGFEIWEGGG
jgi:hypothetical protein